MEDLAHIALWRYVDGRVGAAVLTPSDRGFREAVNRMLIHDCAFDHERSVYMFAPSQISAAALMISQFFPTKCCAICQSYKSHSPCWYWGQRSLVTTAVGGLVHPPMPLPPTPEAQRRAIERITENALSQLASASTNLSSALREVAFPQVVDRRPMPREARRIRPPTQAQPTPVTASGTIRCSTCGQIVPPGFDKGKDTKKTEDEVYAECEHNFDDSQMCRNCKLKKRPTESRFSLLEID